MKIDKINEFVIYIQSEEGMWCTTWKEGVDDIMDFDSWKSCYTSSKIDTSTIYEITEEKNLELLKLQEESNKE